MKTKVYMDLEVLDQILLEFEQYFNNTKKIILDINYRSKSEIVYTANRLIDKIKIDMKKSLSVVRGMEEVLPTFLHMIQRKKPYILPRK